MLMTVVTMSPASPRLMGLELVDPLVLPPRSVRDPTTPVMVLTRLVMMLVTSPPAPAVLAYGRTRE